MKFKISMYNVNSVSFQIVFVQNTLLLVSLQIMRVVDKQASVHSN